MAVANLPWNCPNPYCKDPHNPSTAVVDGVIRCHSCGWERKVAAREPEPVDDLPGLFQVPPRKKDPEE